LLLGQTQSFGYSRPTEEGYEYDNIELERNSGGRDCDGPIDRHSEYVCKIGPDLQADTNCYGDKLPKWQRTKARVRDYYAEAMGY
jgi:hypothetical protein